MTSVEIKKGMLKRQRIGVEYRATGYGWDWPSLGAIFGLSGGIIAALIGSVLIASTWITSAGEILSYEQLMGTVLLFLTIPLLILGAHCLDLMERRKDRTRKIRFDEQSY
jgi:high-affinity Fe2+/Pb2+ permease